MTRPSPAAVSAALADATDEASFVQRLLVDTLHWPLGEAESFQEISYDWDEDDLRLTGLHKKVVYGTIQQLIMPGCPWQVFLFEFKSPEALEHGKGLTGPLRKVLQRLVSKNRGDGTRPAFRREHLLFVCTHRWKHFRFAHFRARPGEPVPANPAIQSFGWSAGGSVKTVSKYNLPHLAFLGEDATLPEWLSAWSAAFDVDRVTKSFFTEYQRLHDDLAGAVGHGGPLRERRWLASVLLNRLMFTYFLQKKGFLAGDDRYLEKRLSDAEPGRFYEAVLEPLFFHGFAKPQKERPEHLQERLAGIRYLNGGLFLAHPIEQAAAAAGEPVTVPDAPLREALGFFARYSWNLNDTPGGEDNEINPDVLGYILEKYINQKAFGAYYTRPEITGFLCERTIHRLVLDAVNTPPGSEAAAATAGLKVRSFETVPQLFKHLDDALAERLLDRVLPELKLLDPACGSGAFLVAAMKTMIDLYAGVHAWVEHHGGKPLRDRLKAVRAGHPSVDYFVKKKIITENLFGVDLMPEAVEIARLRLFLALVASAQEVGDLEPLPNIDFNVLAGNSLIGLLEVDETDFAKSLFVGSYRDVVAERDRRLRDYRGVSGYDADLTSLRDRITAEDAKAERALTELLTEDFRALGIKHERATWDTAKGRAGKPEKRPLEAEDLQRLDPFHWAFSFSAVMERGGFDAILTNPPWEVFKPNGKEFFEPHSDLITKNKMKVKDFQLEQRRLLRDEGLREAWLDHASQFPHQSAWFRAAESFAHQRATANGRRVGGDVNLYLLFLERCHRLLRDDGRCGIVIPSGVYTDLGAKGLREMLFERSRVDALFGMENRKGVFEGVDSRFKFVALSFAKGGTTTSFPAAFMRRDVAELEAFPAVGALPVDVALVEKLSPDSKSLMEFSSDADVSIASKMLRYPLLGEDVEGAWKLRLYREFDMTNDSGLFHDEPGDGRLPLYEGKMVWHFDHRWAEPRYWVDEAAGRGKILGRSSDSGRKLDYQRHRFGFRDIASNTNERSAISSIVPPDHFVGNTLVTQMSGTDTDPSAAEALVLSTIFNSFVFDWLIRQKITTHLSMFYVFQMPVPRLREEDPGFARLLSGAAGLICTTPAFDALAAEVAAGETADSLGVTDPEHRAARRAELDGTIAHLYGLTHAEFAHVLAAFPLVPEATRAAALAAYDRLVETGEADALNPDRAADRAASEAKTATVRGSSEEDALRALIAGGESATCEFKSTARFDLQKNERADYLTDVIVKTVAGFANAAEGGTLLIGVDDAGTVLGLDADLGTLGKKADLDGYELWLTTKLLIALGRDAAAHVSLSFPVLDAKPVCRVDVGPSPVPRFVPDRKQAAEVFYLRTGNQTQALAGNELLSYAKQRWG